MSDDNVTWKHVAGIVGIVSIVWAIIFALGFRLFYPTPSAAALEVRVATVERDIAQIKTDLSSTNTTLQTVANRQSAISDKQDRILRAVEK